MAAPENSDVHHLSPYRDTALLYRQKGFYGPIPLPHKKKEKPPIEFTGHRAAYPTQAQVELWRQNEKPQNIALRLAGCSTEHEVMGIDVDHYQSGGKNKLGGTQLAELERLYGALPATWVSSSRADGISGIRYYRVPRGLAFRGKIDKDIECISKGYRYAIVWPSKHPEGGTYRWYEPGVKPDGKSYVENSIPVSVDLPFLPEKWLEHLTQGRMKAEDNQRIDMDSSVQEIYDWADSTFHGETDTPPCALMRDKINKHRLKIENEATSHDKIVNAHYNIFKLAMEGHVGWNAAVNDVEKCWVDSVTARDKRTLSELMGEVFRSRVNGLRRVKGEIDDRARLGVVPVESPCHQTGQCGGLAALQADEEEDGGVPPGGIDDVPRGITKGVPEYEMTDDGNAEHLTDMFSMTLESGLSPSFRYVEGYGWIVWHAGRALRWKRDELGDQEMRRMWQEVKKVQGIYVEQVLYKEFINQIEAAEKQGLPSRGSGQMVPDALVQARNKFDAWRKFSERSGNNYNAENAIKAAKARHGVALDINELDHNPYLLGVANGVVELDRENVILRDARIDDYITLNTNVPWQEPSKFSQEKWDEYLQMFLPDAELRRITQIALGHCLIGGNPEKIIIALKGDPNTGKSTMINAIEAAMGDYALTVDQGLFKSRQFNSTLAVAMNKRFAICSEFDEEDSLSASMVKRITGGTDKVTSEVKFSMTQISGIPQFVLILATNGVPRITGSDKALQNRLFVIPFNVTPKHIKKETANVIKAICGPAVLNWLIEGYMEYRRLGELPMSNIINEQTEEFASQLDPVATFVYEGLEKHTNISSEMIWEDHPEWCVTRSAMYAHFERWWTENSFLVSKRPSAIAFTMRLRALGIPGTPGKKMKRIGDNLARWWFGVKFAESSPHTGTNVLTVQFTPKPN